MPSSRFPGESELVPIDLTSASKGNQEKYTSKDGKWYYKQNFYYQNRYWRDDLVECIASDLAMLGFKLPNCSVLQQYSAIRFGHHGVFSQNFLNPAEQYISFERITQMKNIQVPYYAGLETFKRVLDVYENQLRLDALDFLLTQCLLDYLVGNEDRHTNNFGAIKTAAGTLRLHPCFDFGLGMFEHDLIYDDYKFRDKLDHMQFRTFDTSQKRLILQLVKTYPQMQQILSNIVVQPSKFQFPSVAGETYLRHACVTLGVRICND